ncbi:MULTISPECIES: hypothetical protein [unclassified Streptomyces]|uniref:hypothetical protein n=1 Tax=unclassified Streptomyces TaxID=2593676 RepID=UPI002E2BFB94|nr:MULTISPECIES: hypothetical protein [unclassified Streptomyces]
MRPYTGLAALRADRDPRCLAAGLRDAHPRRREPAPSRRRRHGPAHYGVHVEARRTDGTGYTLLPLGPYTQTWLASRDADRLNTTLEGRTATVIPGLTVTAKDAVFDVSDHASYTDPYDADVTALLVDAVAGVSA